MKRKSMAALLMAVIMIVGAVGVSALDYLWPEDAQIVTARFSLVEPDTADSEFAMVSEDGSLVINVTDSTIIYFEDFVPLSDDCTGATQMVREVLFGRTLGEVLDGRNMRVIYEDGEQNEAVSIMVLFEIAVAMPPLVLSPEDLAGLEGNYVGVAALPGVLVFENIEYIELNGEVVVNNEILEGAAAPFWQEIEDGYEVMVPLRAVAEALGYDVNWDETLRSIRLGVAIHVWVGNTEAHVGRMAPIELSTAPVIVDDLTFVPIDFFRNVLGQTAYVFEGQVVIETDSDMM